MSTSNITVFVIFSIAFSELKKAWKYSTYKLVGTQGHLVDFLSMLLRRRL